MNMEQALKDWGDKIAGVETGENTFYESLLAACRYDVISALERERSELERLRKQSVASQKHIAELQRKLKRYENVETSWIARYLSGSTIKEGT